VLVFRWFQMDFFEVLGKRASTRLFLKRAVEGEKIERLLWAVNTAPSAGNLQAYRVAIVRDADAKKALGEAAFGQSFVALAPIVLVFLAEPQKSAARYGERGEALYCIQDATIACCYAQLAAVALGLASVWVGAFDEAMVKRAIGLGGGQRPVAILPLGYAAETPAKPARRNIGDTAFTAQKPK
jgi:nitroreductase